MPGAHLGRNNHPTGLILRNNTWHTSEHGLGRTSKNKNQLSHDKQITEVGHTLLCRRETGILTQRVGHPLHSVRVFHGTLSGKVYPETIMIMGRWESSVFQQYIHIQVSDLGKVISNLMKTNHTFYTIPEIEVVYHTPVHDNTYQQRLILNRLWW